MRDGPSRLLPILTVCAVAFGATMAVAGGQDEAWARNCVAERTADGRSLAGLRRYCACMVDIVGADGPSGVTELERRYPPAHARCSARSGLRDRR